MHWSIRALLFAALFCLTAAAEEQKWADDFKVDEKNWVSTGRNTYFILEPGYQLVLEGTENDKKTVLTITVLNETKKVDGVETRVIEEREVADGQVAEISRNYFAIDKTTNSVYYFGEDVDIYKDGKVVDHGGSWLSGEKGAKYGLMMPGTIKGDECYYQERAPDVARDRAEVVSTTKSVETPAGKFKHCLKTKETSGLSLMDKEYKYYAPDVGLIRDEELKLVKYGNVEK